LFEWRLPRLVEDRLDDFERDADLPFLPFASTRAENGQATEMMKRTAVNIASGLGDCRGIVSFMVEGAAPGAVSAGLSWAGRYHSWRRTDYGLFSEIKMRG
jgi:hypothetical protein